MIRNNAKLIQNENQSIRTDTSHQQTGVATLSTQTESVTTGVWHSHWPGPARDSASRTDGEVSSAQTLWIEWGGWFPKGNPKCFYQKKERQKLSRRNNAVCIRHAASYRPAPNKGRSNRKSFRNVSPVCCRSHPFPRLIVIHRAPVQPWARLWRFQ